MRYAAEPPGGVIRVALDSLTALYHRRSGQTHVVAPPVPELLDILGRGPHSIDALLEALGVDDDAEARAILVARMDELVETGLVGRE